jgi:hypothetical protein
MGAELVVSDEVSRWFEWLVAADPGGARELRDAVDEYALAPDPTDGVAFDVCLSPSSRGMGFVAVHLAGKVLIATGAEVGESVRRCMTLLRRAEKVVRKFRGGRLEVRPWSEVRKWMERQ